MKAALHTPCPFHVPLSILCLLAADFTGSAPGVRDEMSKRLTLGDGEAREKQRWGRLMKLKGDMCLMCGSPRDAYEHYK